METQKKVIIIGGHWQGTRRSDSSSCDERLLKVRISGTS